MYFLHGKYELFQSIYFFSRIFPFIIYSSCIFPNLKTSQIEHIKGIMNLHNKMLCSSKPYSKTNIKSFTRKHLFSILSFKQTLSKIYEVVALRGSSIESCRLIFAKEPINTPGNQSPVYERHGSLLQDDHRSTVRSRSDQCSKSLLNVFFFGIYIDG